VGLQGDRRLSQGTRPNDTARPVASARTHTHTHQSTLTNDGPDDPIPLGKHTPHGARAPLGLAGRAFHANGGVCCAAPLAWSVSHPATPPAAPLSGPEPRGECASFSARCDGTSVTAQRWRDLTTQGIALSTQLVRFLPGAKLLEVVLFEEQSSPAIR
jgi:hypothetical protein